MEASQINVEVATSNNIEPWCDDSHVPPLRDPNVLREEVLYQLRTIIDPDLNKDIVTLGFVKSLCIDYDSQRVSFTLELTTPACPVKDQFVADATRLLTNLGWIEDVQITLSSRRPGLSRMGLPSANLAGVSTIIAVASCKGGVGKSSVACNMAYMLTNLGARVGLVDADVYGPSLPYLVPVQDQRVYFSARDPDQHEHRSCQPPTSVNYEGSLSGDCCSDKNVDDDGDSSAQDALQKALASGSGGLMPLIYEGVKMMSYGYLKSLEYAAVRGPIISTIVYEMVTKTFWGELDYLIIDLPPGTGDIHLTLAQSVPITCAVMVTTPQQLSVVDVERGIAMFNNLKIPTVAVVENMACFTCPSCATTCRVFSQVELPPEVVVPFNGLTAVEETQQQNVDRLTQQFGITIRALLPMHPDFASLRFRRLKGSLGKKSASRDSDDLVFPFVRAFDERHPVWQALKKLCEDVIREISVMKFSANRAPDLHVIENDMMEMVIRHPLPNYGKGTELNNGVLLGKETVLHAPCREIRLSCRCAECVDEFTGRSKLNPRRIPGNIHVKAIEPSGNYAISIQWSDGHQSLLSFTTLETLFRQYMENKSLFRNQSLCGSATDESSW